MIRGIRDHSLRTTSTGNPRAGRLGVWPDREAPGNQGASGADSARRSTGVFPRPTRVPRSMTRNWNSSPSSSRPGPCSGRSGGARTGPLFSRVEVLPPTRTVLPYGVGAFQQELRLPTILTTGPGWASQNPEEKEAVAAQAFRELSQGIEALKLDPPLRPTLTIQTPSGLELAWMNDLDEGRRNIHGDDSQPFPAPQPTSPAQPPALPPPPRPVERGKSVNGDEP